MTTKIILGFALAASMSTPLVAQNAPPTWRPEPNLTNRSSSAMALDEARQVVLLFGGDDSGGVGSGLGDTWAWRENHWIPLSLPVAPLPRMGHAMAYDRRNGVIILHGGRDAAYRVNRADTWVWNGTNWDFPGTGNGPGGRSDFAMAFDPGLGKVILFGGWSRNSNGVRADTWAWDQLAGSWTRLNPAQAPPARMGHRMVLDERSQSVVLYGGRAGRTGTAFNDTWIWSGGNWTLAAPTQTPPPQSDHAMAYDPVRGRAILFGAQNETWEWTGSDWQRGATGAVSPPVEQGHVMAPTPLSGEVLLFGGNRGNTGIKRSSWLYDGQRWRETSTSPPMRHFPAMAYDARRRRLVMFGGRQFYPFLEDTWEWDGERWHELHPASNPPAELYFNQMIYRPASGRCVLYAGKSGSSEMWEWNGASWSSSSPAGSPPARRWTAIAHDTRRDRTVLFGGIDQPNGTRLDDTWEWDGSTWTRMVSPTAPAPRHFHSMSYDPHRGKIVLFGGETANGLSHETWEWDGSIWVLRLPPASPPVSTGAALAYSFDRERTVLYGGGPGIQTGLSSHETWEWDGNTWTRTVDFPTTGREFAGMVYDSARQRMVLFGGSIDTPVSLTFDSPDVWTYFSEQHYFSPFPISIGQTLTLGVDIPAEAQMPFLIALSTARYPGIPLRIDPLAGPIEFPLAPDPLLFATLGHLGGNLDGNGHGELRFPIPPLPLLASQTFHSAAFTLHRGPGQIIGAITNETVIILN